MLRTAEPNGHDVDSSHELAALHADVHWTSSIEYEEEFWDYDRPKPIRHVNWKKEGF